MIKVVITGEFDGFPVTYEETFNEAPANGFLVGITEFLKSEGLAASAAAPAPANVTSFAQRVNSGQAQPAQDGDWSCSLHPQSKPRPGYQNRGWECSYFSPNKFDGSRDKVWTNKEGTEYRWYCASKSWASSSASSTSSFPMRKGTRRRTAASPPSSATT